MENDHRVALEPTVASSAEFAPKQSQEETEKRESCSTSVQGSESQDKHCSFDACGVGGIYSRRVVSSFVQ